MPNGFEGRVFPFEYRPPSGSTPANLFPYNSRYHRFEHRNDCRNLLIFTDGACSNNGGRDATAGWGFVYSADGNGSVGSYARYPSRGETALQTSNRAELRAVLDALDHRDWRREGYRQLTIATDSRYVVDGATSWAREWVSRNWVKRDGQAVKNRDLWYALLAEIECLHDEGLDVDFWWIPRHLNTEADSVAKDAAEMAALDRQMEHLRWN